MRRDIDVPLGRHPAELGVIVQNLRRVFATVVGVAALTIPMSAVAVAAPAPTATTEYANLGDSYSAGSGVLPLAPRSPLLCARSQKDFSHLIAAQRGYRLTDVSCGSAKTAQYYGPQFPILGTRAQLDAITPTTDIVTVMMGGNDARSLGGLLTGCITATLTHPGESAPCTRIQGRSLIDPIFSQTLPALIKGLRAIRAKAPTARVFAVGYPVVFPKSGECFPATLIKRGDVGYARSVGDALNLAIKRAAEATGATFVDMEPATDGHDACAPAGVRYIEPIIGARQLVPMHPNARGEAVIAEQVLAAIDKG